MLAGGHVWRGPGRGSSLSIRGFGITSKQLFWNWSVHILTHTKVQNLTSWKAKIKIKKVKGLNTCYSASYMIQTQEQQRFTISEVAADWHALRGYPLPALTDNWTRGAASKHTTPQSATLGLHPVPHSFAIPLRCCEQ